MRYMEFWSSCSQHWLVEVWFGQIKGKQGTVINTCNPNTYEVEAGGSGVWDQLNYILSLYPKQNKTLNHYNDDGVDNNNLEGLIYQWAMASKLSLEDNMYLHVKHSKH